MPLDMPITKPTNFDPPFSRPRVAARRRSAQSRPAANDAVARDTAGVATAVETSRPIDPMLLVWEERVRTFRLLARMMRRYAALLGWASRTRFRSGVRSG